MTANELAGLGGLPKTPQGVNTRARLEGWVKRKREGIKGGKAVEYNVDSIPANTRKLIESEIHFMDKKPEESQSEDTLSTWSALLNSISKEERKSILNHALANGMSSLIPRETSQRAIKIAELIESMPEDDQREILRLIEVKKLGALLNNNPERKKA